MPFTFKTSHPPAPPMDTEPAGRLVQGPVVWKRRPGAAMGWITWSRRKLTGVVWTCPRCGKAKYQLFNEKIGGKRTLYYFECWEFCPQRSTGVDPVLLEALAKQFSCKWPGPFVPVMRTVSTQTKVLYQGPNTPASWAQMAAHTDPAVRMAVAREARCPEVVLTTLCRDPDAAVAKAAAKTLAERE